MGSKSKIEWTDATWNPFSGCSRTSPGCMNCYAEDIAYRFKGSGLYYEGLIASTGQWNGVTRVNNDAMDQPIRWKKPRKIFVNSMSDTFHENFSFDEIDKIFGVMWACLAIGKDHVFQVLTKRADRMHEYFRTERRDKWARAAVHIGVWDDPDWVSDFITSNIGDHPNIWLGVSVENQEYADKRIPYLMNTPAAVRFVSAEPLLGPVDLVSAGAIWSDINGTVRPEYQQENKTISLVIVGGESGNNARPMQSQWVRQLRNDCVNAKIPFFFKQWGEYAPNWFNDANGNKLPDSEWMDRMGKKIAGNQLDGEIYQQFPNHYHK